MHTREVRTDPRELHEDTVDFLVVGGGIQGVGIARELALRGASVLVAERDDFAAGTSSGSSRLVHGGVRYLEQGHVPLVREALHERERLLRLAPHLVRPLPLLMPFYEDSGKSRLLVRVGLWLYSVLAGRRSAVPRPRWHAPQECLRLFPGLRGRGLRSGVVYYDAVTEDAPLTLAVAAAASRAGARLANHCEVAGLVGDRVLLRDHVTGEDVAVRTRRVVNAAGPWADAVRRTLGIEGADLLRTSRGSHVVLPPRESQTALAAFLPDGRIQFVVPHDDGTICGTTDVDDDHFDSGVPEEDARYLLEALGYLLEPPPGRRDVRFAYCAWRSLPAAKGPPGALNREAFTVCEHVGEVEVHTVVGGKLTTHRSFAERTVARLTGARGPSPSRTEPLPGGDGPKEPGDPLWNRHGSLAGDVRRLAAGRPELLEPICPHRPFLGVEVFFGVRERAAVTFSDLALRRLFSSMGPCLAGGCLRAMHRLFLEARAAPGREDFEHAREELLEAVRRRAGVFYEEAME